VIVRAALPCLNDGWNALGSTPGKPFASEQACVDFANAGGTPVALGAADLAVDKAVSSSTPNVGDTVTFTITVSDLGPDPATGVQLSDLLPAGLTFVTATPSQGTYSSASGQWTVGTVTTTVPQTLAIEARVVSPDARTNTATISHSDQFDPVTGNNSASATETPQRADLAVNKAVSDATPKVGDNVIFTVTLSDLGPDPATGVQLSDVLPAGLTFVSATPSQGTYSSATGQWTVGTVTTTVPQTVRIEAQVVSADAQANTATISHSDQFDPVSGNNSASATETPQRAADLAVDKTVSSSTPNVGETVTFTITVRDLGPDTATGVELTDVLPAGLTFVSATPSQGTYSSATGQWTVGTVTTTVPQTLRIESQVVSADAHTNTATISHADEFDPVSGNNSASATITPAAPPPAGPGPIKVGPTGRYLVDQKGAPFLISGESPQALIGDLTESDAALFFANRRAHGFNTVWINLLCNAYTGCQADGSTWDGISPFTTPGDFSTPNEAYFAHADRILRLAADYGFVVLLDPAETGGWLSTMVSNGVAKDRAYGQYLGTRYKDFPNIIWMHGNDYQDWGPTNDPYVTAVAQGIRDVDPSRLQTVELNYRVSGSLDDPAWAGLIDLNASYTYEPTYQQVLKDYNRADSLPTFLVEASYEFEQDGQVQPAQQMRRQEYWSLLSGATGQLYGNHYTWQFICPQRDAAGNCVGGWKDQLDTPGATQMAYLAALFESRPWYALVPDQAHTIVTGGLGTFGLADYVTAASTPDGTLAMAYVPSNRTITVDMSRFSGPVTARWYDPSAGTFASISGTSFPNSGSRQFTTPGANADGTDDWVLVLEVN
jgi:uncharacterized repeat protein (TIGR01451 family)